jgi:hypothetical protein
VTASELFSAMMSAGSVPEVSRLASQHLRPGRPVQHVDISPMLTAAHREHLDLPEGHCVLRDVVRALIRHTDTEETTR